VVAHGHVAVQVNDYVNDHVNVDHAGLRLG